MKITILGLGPGSPAHLTREAWQVLSEAEEVYLRTRHHPTVASLPPGLSLHSFDHLYETENDFAAIYSAIASRILDLGQRPQGVLYAVPGHPLVGESSVQLVLTSAREMDCEIRLVSGLSFVEPVLGQLGIDGLTGLQLVDATDLAAAHHPPLDPDRPALVGQLYGQRLAGDVKLTLMNAYPDEHPVTLVQSAGTEESTKTTLALYELDRYPQIDHLTTLYVGPLTQTSGMPAFQDTVARLRAPGGCPWDREQTHQSLRDCLLEETYEVLAALDDADDDKLSEELGDLLMQIAMHVQIATEGGAFQLADVIGRIDAKLKRRHPHVFGDVQVNDAAEVLRNWEAIKDNERALVGAGSPGAPQSRLAGVPAILPALARAQAMGERVARVGFDWPDVEGVLAKLGEEVSELELANDEDSRFLEFGDLLFTLANLARWLGLNAESALRQACDRFANRFAIMEQAARSQDAALDDLSPAELDALWERAKSQTS